MSTEFPNDQLVLVIEDEPLLRSSMVRGLSRIDGVEVVDAGTVADGVRLCTHLKPHLIVSDLDLPDGSGIEFLRFADEGRIPILFVSGYVGRFRGQLPTRPDIRVFDKPIPLQVLRRQVLECLGQGPQASVFGLADFMQLAGMGQRSMVLEVVSDEGFEGSILIHRGSVWAVHDRQGTGLDALQRLLFLDGCRVLCKALTEAPHAVQPLGTCEALLLEAFRLHDEAHKDDAPPSLRLEGGALAHSSFPNPRTLPPRLSSAPRPSRSLLPARSIPAAPFPSAGSIPPRRGTERTVAPSSRLPPLAPQRFATFDDAYDQGIDALLRKDHRGAFEAFCAASSLRPDDARVVANLKRLRELMEGDDHGSSRA